MQNKPLYHVTVLSFLIGLQPKLYLHKTAFLFSYKFRHSKKVTFEPTRINSSPFLPSEAERVLDFTPFQLPTKFTTKNGTFLTVGK